MQSTVNTTFALGVIGEFFDDGPRRVSPGILVSSDATQNVIGRVVTFTNLGNADGTAQSVVQAGGTGTFAGILVAPKTYATSGTTSGALAPTMALPNNTTVEYARMGAIIVALDATAGDTSALKYTNATGVIAVGSAGAGETAIPNARVVRFANTGASLGVIELTN